jgi:hypothetical protein
VRTRLIPLFVVQDPVSAQGLILGHPYRTDSDLIPKLCKRAPLVLVHPCPSTLLRGTREGIKKESSDGFKVRRNLNCNNCKQQRMTFPRRCLVSSVRKTICWRQRCAMAPLRLATSLRFFLHNFSEIHILKGHETETAWSNSEVRSKIVLRCVLM